MSENIISSYRDPCDKCDALCCRVYRIDNPKDSAFFGIPLKVQHLSCGNLDEKSSCSIYQTRSEAGFSVCEEHSCYSVGPIVQEWAKNSGLMVSHKNEGPQENNDHNKIALCMNKARQYVMDLLFGKNDTIDITQVSPAKLQEACTHIEIILREVRPDDPGTIRDTWESYLYPKRLLTTREKEQKEELQRNSLLSFTL